MSLSGNSGSSAHSEQRSGISREGVIRTMSAALPDPEHSNDGSPLLVVAAFWAKPGDSNELQPLVDRGIKGSGAVVTFTPEQAEQPGLWESLRQFKLTEPRRYYRQFRSK